MQISAQELASQFNGVIEGEASVVVHCPSKIEDAVEGSISFVANPKYVEYLLSTRASIVLVSEDLEYESTAATVIKVSDPYQCFAKVLGMFFPQRKVVPGVHEKAFVSQSAKVDASAQICAGVFVGDGVEIGANSYIGPNTCIEFNSVIGSNCVFHSGVQVYDNMIIGSNVTLHSGAVIGSDGFGFAESKGVQEKVPQTGNVILEDFVEIGANSTVDRATMGSTIIEKGVKLDNLVQVAHNCKIGANTVIAAQTGVSGSTELGAGCVVGGQVGFVGHIKIAPGTMIAAQSGVARATSEPTILSGSPAIDHHENKKAFMVYKQLPDMYRKLQAVLKKIEG